MRRVDFSTAGQERNRLLQELADGLPREFFDFYQKFDGGVLDLYFVGADGNEYNICAIFSINEMLEFRRTTHVYQREDDLLYPDGVLEFGRDWGGCFFAIGVKEKYFGQVIYIETGADDCGQRVYEVAVSFNEFLALVGLN